MIKELKQLSIGLSLLGVMIGPLSAETMEEYYQQSAAAAETQKAETQTVTKPQHKNKHKHKHYKKHAYNSSDFERYQLPQPSHNMQGEVSGKTHAATMQNLDNTSVDNLPFDMDVPGQSFVSTGPYIGVPIMYSGGDLIINTPNINEDVSLLNIRKHIRQRLVELGRPLSDDHAHLLLSGIVEGQAFYQEQGNGSNTSDVDLTSAELDGYILGPSSWTSGLLAFAYDNDRGSQVGSINSNSRPVNSRVYINKAFIVIGDFQKSPFYGTIGQMYVPFGTYSTNMVSSPLTKLLGRTKARALLVGYQQQTRNAGYGALYAFKGDSYVGNTDRINNGGLNIGYRFHAGMTSADVGGGVIANLADSILMQRTGNQPLFGGFGGTDGSGNEQLIRSVPAYDLRGIFSIGDHLDLLGEFIGAAHSFSPDDLTFNGHGAVPQAINLEAAYTFNAFSKPSTIAVGYGKAKDTLALGIPAQRYSMVFNTSIWKDTLQSLEFRHDMNYAASDTSSGSLVPGPSGLGDTDNTLTFQFDIFF